MSVRFVFSFSSGGTLEVFSSEYRSVDDARQMLERALRGPDSIINWHQPDGSVHVIRAAHVVAVTVTQAAADG